MKQTFFSAAMAATLILTGCAQNEVLNSESEFAGNATRVAVGAVVINEIKVSDDGDDTNDWIELFNTTEEPIIISGFKLHDGGGITKAWTIPTTTILGKSHVTFTEGEHFQFGLGKSGDSVTLLDAIDSVLDSVSPKVELNDNVNPAYARIPDGSENWQPVAEPTKDASNGEWSQAIGDVVINEIKVSDSGTDVADWIELYNRSGAQINIGNYKLTDAGGAIYTIPVGTIIAKGEHKVFEQSAFLFGLGKSKEIVSLTDNIGTVLDTAMPTVELNDNVYPAWARTTDGGDVWAATATPTKGTENQIGQPATIVDSHLKGDIVINEVKVSGYADESKDWIELRNTTGTPIFLYGLTLTDAGGGSFTIIDEELEIDEYYTFTEDAVNSFTFGLGKTGEIVTLYDGDGGLIDEIELVGTFEDNVYPAYARNYMSPYTWAQTSTPTYNVVNEITEYVNPGQSADDYVGLVINEVKAAKSGNDDADFIELYYNGTQASLEIGGLKIYDGGGFAKAWTIPAGTTIYKGGFNTFTEDVHFSFGLSAKGDETVTLAIDATTEVDSVELPVLTDGTMPAYARITDGTENWAPRPSTTKDASNN